MSTRLMAGTSEHDLLPEGVWPVLRTFAPCAPTAEAFYLHFNTLPRPTRPMLRQRWLAPAGLAATDWALYRRICHFWGVGAKLSPADRRARAAHQLDDLQGRFDFERRVEGARVPA